MLKILKKICLKLRWPARRRQKQKQRVVIQQLGKSNSRTRHHDEGASAVIHPSRECNGGGGASEKPIRIATFNAALFSMAPAIPKPHRDSNKGSNSSSSFDFDSDEFTVPGPRVDFRAKSMVLERRPKGILKQSPLHSSSVRVDSGGIRIYGEDDGHSNKQKQFTKPKLRVSINLPDNEISLRRSGHLTFIENENSPSSRGRGQSQSFTRTILEVLTELNADVLALQDVKAEEERGMSPLSELAEALGMHYAFAESWAPEYGNAILSRWPIKGWKSHKIFDDSDHRNVLKATIDVPEVGDFDVYCTRLDHLDENWRMKQINAIIQASETPHILAGGINSLEESDYSAERWTDIVKFYEEIGKPTPKFKVMKHLKSKKYTDAKDFAGECESVVMIAKGQSVQGTCKYGTRVDYVLSSPGSPYKFVPGSYSVFSSKGTSDHHIVKVDVVKVVNSNPNEQECTPKKMRARKKVVKITHNSSPANGIWKVEEAIGIN